MKLFANSCSELFASFGLAVTVFINMLKSTSIVGYIAIQDLTKISDIIRSRTYEAFFPLLATALIYFVTAWFLASFLGWLDDRLDPVKRRRKKLEAER